MGDFKSSVDWRVLLVLILLMSTATAGIGEASSLAINARSAVVIDMSDGNVLFEQNPDELIPPASLTKILTLYIVFEAIETGVIRLSDSVPISARAVRTSGSRMGLRAGRRVPLEELIKGMAVVSGNDACLATAEYMSGSVDEFVKRMNEKARQLGMTNSRFMTPNGLPAKGQLTTARDIAKLSIAYLKRFPDSLEIHSMQSYTYERSSHHNANRLLGKCPGVDGLKTGFVCASGYNISATGKRGDVRILAVVMGAPTPRVRMVETGKLLEAGFRSRGLGVENADLAQTLSARGVPTGVVSKKARRAPVAKAAPVETASKKAKASACAGKTKEKGNKNAKSLTKKGTGKTEPVDRNKAANRKNGKKSSVQHDAAASEPSSKPGKTAGRGGNVAPSASAKKTL